MRDLGHGARHVIVRGHHDQRLEAVLARPAPGLDGVAEGVDAPSGRDRCSRRRACMQPASAARSRARAGGALTPRDQQPAPRSAARQLDRIADAATPPPVSTTMPSALRERDCSASMAEENESPATSRRDAPPGQRPSAVRTAAPATGAALRPAAAPARSSSPILPQIARNRARAPGTKCRVRPPQSQASTVDRRRDDQRGHHRDQRRPGKARRHSRTSRSRTTRTEPRTGRRRRCRRTSRSTSEQREQQDRAAAADGAALQPKPAGSGAGNCRQ